MTIRGRRALGRAHPAAVDQDQAPQTRAGALSGGNLQKVVLGKCLAVEPRVLLLNNPTRGVDVGARVEIYRSLREAADRGLGILLASEDLNELIGLSDRILICALDELWRGSRIQPRRPRTRSSGT